MTQWRGGRAPFEEFAFQACERDVTCDLSMERRCGVRAIDSCKGDGRPLRRSRSKSPRPREGANMHAGTEITRRRSAEHEGMQKGRAKDARGAAKLLPRRGVATPDARALQFRFTPPPAPSGLQHRTVRKTRSLGLPARPRPTATLQGTIARTWTIAAQTHRVRPSANRLTPTCQHTHNPNGAPCAYALALTRCSGLTKL